MDNLEIKDSFTEARIEPMDPLVKRHYDALNDFLSGKSDEFLGLWHEGHDSVLFFNLSERERGGEAIRKTFRQIRNVLSRVPVGTTLQASQIHFEKHGDMAFAVTMEKAVSELDKRTVVSEHRGTIIWKKIQGHWRLVHLHNDTYDRREETLSELLRGYHPDA